eukprot:1841262-Rhodomonas_salina.1
MSGTDIAHAAPSVPMKSDTGIAYEAVLAWRMKLYWRSPCHSVSCYLPTRIIRDVSTDPSLNSTAIPHAATRLHHVRYWPSDLPTDVRTLRVCYAMSGTDLAYGGSRLRDGRY